MSTLCFYCCKHVDDEANEDLILTKEQEYFPHAKASSWSYHESCYEQWEVSRNYSRSWLAGIRKYECLTPMEEIDKLPKFDQINLRSKARNIYIKKQERLIFHNFKED